MVLEYSPDPVGEDLDTVKSIPSLQTGHFGNDSNSDSDLDEGIEYFGYEPIPLGPDLVDATCDDEDEPDSQEDDTVSQSNVDYPNLPPAPPSAGEELLKEVWSTPSQPMTIPMDATKEEQIKNAMANFTLPESSIPKWAASVPDEDLKQHLDELMNQQKINDS